ncbi:hypothetical protein [Tateyamaria sp. Alg231-49]|uniref:hypothetical protein n=1 Tax=Tateyamaria sp. Alg231-49 TaxID=1922219 RepID=UPI000D54E659|nr:hypothetical protein [Tateyamaria sp. Alg231-49]
MGDIALRGPELKKFVKLAKKRDLNFAYCPGNDPKEDVFVLDRKKNPEVIGRVARGEGTGTKAAIGTARVKGRVMMLTCLKEVPQAAKKLKKFLKSEKVPMNIVIMDKDGNVLEEDIEDLPDDPDLDTNDDEDNDAEDEVQAEEQGEDSESGNDVQDGNTNEERLKKLKAQALTLQGAIGGLPEKAQPRMAKALKTVVAAMKAGQLDAAEATLAKLDDAITKLGAQAKPGAAQNPENDAALERLSQDAAALSRRLDSMGDAESVTRLRAAHALLLTQIEKGNVKKATETLKALSDAVDRAANEASGDTARDNQQDDDTNQDTDALDVTWRDARADLEPVALDLLQRNLGDVTKMRAVLGYFIEKGEAGDFAGGMKAAPGLRKLIADAQAAEQTAAEQDIPAGVVPFVHARLDWIRTRASLSAEMTKLQDAIINTCDEDEFPGIASETKRLFAYLDKLDGRLEDALDALIQEPDGDKREKLKADAVRVMTEYLAELNTDFFQAVDGNNGFKPVNVRNAAVDSLGKVRALLSEAA